MEEELYEWDLVWPENLGRPTGAAINASDGHEQEKVLGARSSTAPVDVPSSTSCAAAWEHSGEEEQVPPHVLLSRGRMAWKEAFSLCSGHGRTLKGRDLCRFRDAVLRMTGFLEG